VRSASCIATATPERQFESLGKHTDEVLGACCQRRLTGTDAESGANRGELRKIAVGTQREEVSAQDGDALLHAANRARLLVEADQCMFVDLIHAARRTEALEIETVGMKSHAHRADALEEQGLLARFDHANRDIRLASQEVGDIVGGHELKHEFRIFPFQSGKDRRQHFDADYLAGRDADGSSHGTAAARCGAQ